MENKVVKSEISAIQNIYETLKIFDPAEIDRILTVVVTDLRREKGTENIANHQPKKEAAKESTMVN